MKKLSIALILILALALGLTAPTLAASLEIYVFVDGVRLELDVKPVLTNGRTLVPFRAIFERLGYSVVWNQGTQQATATKTGRTIVMRANSKQATVNGVTNTLDVAATITNGRFLVPLRFIGEASGYNVQWDGTAQSVYVGTPPNPKPDRTVKMYAGYPTVPDFGAFSGKALEMKFVSGRETIYMYDRSSVSTSLQNQYIDLLKENSFVDKGTYNLEGYRLRTFTKGGVRVSVGIYEEGYFAVSVIPS